MDVNIVHRLQKFITFLTSLNHHYQEVIDERHLAESKVRYGGVENGSILNVMVSLEQTSLSASRSMVRRWIEVGSYSVTGVSDIVHEVCIRSTTLMAWLHPTCVRASSGNRVTNNYILAASSTE